MFSWQCDRFRLDLGRRPLIMGILNVTPDSFSDSYSDLEQAQRQAGRLIRDGADIIDVGGESTRPGSDSISIDTELARVIPVIEYLATHCDLLLSIDTQKAEVARAALAAGAHIVNHVSATLDFHNMLPVLAQSNAGYVAMHMRGRPKAMQHGIAYENVVVDIADQLKTVRSALDEAAISRERVLFDPGIGFGKTLEHNLEIMNDLTGLVGTLERPLLMGISRKSWFTHFFDDPLPDMAERDAYTAVAGLFMPHPAVAVHRVHNVRLFRNALRLAHAFKVTEGHAPGSFPK